MDYTVIDRHGREVGFDIELIERAIVRILQSMSSNNQHADNDLENYHAFIRLLAELDWPAYLNEDRLFHQLVLDAYEAKGVEGVEAEIYNYYDPLYLKTLEDHLANSNVINQERIPLFHEAFLLYQLGYYYGTVAILITQIVGITADIEKFLKKHSAAYNPETLRLIHSRYGFDKQTDTSRVMTAVLEGKSLDDAQGEYNYLLGYLRCKVFRSNIPKSQRKEEFSKHPNRHYLCHGVQLTYGTREHALKSILCIDSLTWVAQAISDSITAETNN